MRNKFLKNKTRIVETLLVSMFLLSTLSCNMRSNQNKPAQCELDAVTVLQNTLHTQKEWIKVHAAEFLLWGGYPDRVKEVFLNENELYGEQPFYRIGIWRVLAQTETDKEQKEVWVDKIRQAYHAKDGVDRLHAIETLAKLNVSVQNENIEGDNLDNFSVYKLWNSAYLSSESFDVAQDSLLKIAVSDKYEPLIRTISAYSLKKMGKLNDSLWISFASQAIAEREDSPIRSTLLNASVITAGQHVEKTELYKNTLETLKASYSEYVDPTVMMNVFDALAEKGNSNDLELLCTFINKTRKINEPATVDLLSNCAYAVIKICDRER